MNRWFPVLLCVASFALTAASGVIAAPQSQALKPPITPVDKAWPDAAGMAERRREAERRRLFRTADPIAVTLTADFKTVMRDRDPKSTATFPATISFPAVAATT